MHLGVPAKDLSIDSEYITLFLSALETESSYIKVPRVLNDPICNLASHLDEIGLCAYTPTKPLQELLSDCLQCPIGEYHQMMVDWLGHEATNIPMIEKWLAVHGLTLADYLAHLRNGGTSDGLKLWAFSLATNKPVTIIQESSVWSMSMQGADFQQIIITMTSYTSGSLCTEEQSEAEDMPERAEGVANPSPEPGALLLKRSGRPHILPMDSPSSSSDDSTMTTSTDPKDLMEVEEVLALLMPKSSQPKQKRCSVCTEELHSGLVLERHMQYRHPLVKPFQCLTYPGVFNNSRDLSSHVANVHQ